MPHANVPAIRRTHIVGCCGPGGPSLFTHRIGATSSQNAFTVKTREERAARWKTFGRSALASHQTLFPAKQPTAKQRGWKQTLAERERRERLQLGNNKVTMTQYNRPEDFLFLRWLLFKSAEKKAAAKRGKKRNRAPEYSINRIQ